MKDMRKVILIIFTIILILFSSTIVSSTKIWKPKRKELWINLMNFYSDEEMKKNNTYDKLRAFFNECITPKDFYDRIEQYVGDYYKDGDSDLPPDVTQLSIIVDEVIDNDAVLYCNQQAYLFIAGVIAIYSHYGEDLQKYVLNEGCGDFKLEIWRSFDLHPPILPYRSHEQVVVDKWNGTEFFEINGRIANRVEVDTWEDEYRAYHKRLDCLIFPFFPAKLNSVIYTKTVTKSQEY